MAHTFSCLYVHAVFATKFRRALIAPEIRPLLWSYIGGVARENRFRALTVNGMSEHAHVLLSINPAISISKSLQLIKTASSAWMSDVTGKNFKWQEGYAAFSVSLSNLSAVKSYIDNQEEHHRKFDFATEWKLLLERHGIVLTSANSQSSG
jgi:putative transposase